MKKGMLADMASIPFLLAIPDGYCFVYVPKIHGS
ncbi:hypothetical protein SAMN05421659_10121 [[Clostridium] fimetarium]|uniref:Uncharacterized protein n=1 Tax=[Clostridium] fimetarium TaxID=99656 RepID=A0A1I0LZL6_9FIRM|nr:hypothetical protein SAMN05421659_10121 [[Clostridium] fimetarium]